MTQDHTQQGELVERTDYPKPFELNAQDLAEVTGGIDEGGVTAPNKPKAAGRA
jgi:hypothetical protein